MLWIIQSNQRRFNAKVEFELNRREPLEFRILPVYDWSKFQTLVSRQAPQLGLTWPSLQLLTLHFTPSVFLRLAELEYLFYLGAWFEKSIQNIFMTRIVSLCGTWQKLEKTLHSILVIKIREHDSSWVEACDRWKGRLNLVRPTLCFFNKRLLI